MVMSGTKKLIDRRTTEGEVTVVQVAVPATHRSKSYTGAETDILGRPGLMWLIRMAAS